VQDVVKVVPVCSTVFDVLQKLYVLIEGSPKRHSEYLSCLSDLRLENGPSSAITVGHKVVCEMCQFENRVSLPTCNKAIFGRSRD